LSSSGNQEEFSGGLISNKLIIEEASIMNESTLDLDEHLEYGPITRDIYMSL
jgi:hypothetical protein